MFRCVFDTNSVVSAALVRDSVPRQALIYASRLGAILMTIELAVNGRADYIVTGDDNLLVLNPFRGIAIIRPVEFLTIAAPGEQR